MAVKMVKKNPTKNKKTKQKERIKQKQINNFYFRVTYRLEFFSFFFFFLFSNKKMDLLGVTKKLLRLQFL